MHYPELFLITGQVIFVFVTAVWLLSLALKNAAIMDIFWGIGFILVTWLAFVLAPQGFLPRRQLISTLVTVWGLRLALHIGVRSWRQPEDFRYARWREQYGARWWWLSWFRVFLLQGFLMWIISMPLTAAQTAGFPVIITPLEIAAVLVWMFGLLFESIGDLQLMTFKERRANQGKLLTKGLWKFTRHPNYFGEAVVWWGFYLIAVAAGFWWTIFSPLLMTFLLVRVSGVAMLERTLRTRPGYAEYMRRTSAFIPWLPKK